MNTATFYLNKDSAKTFYDLIKIHKQEDGSFNVSYQTNVSDKTEKTKQAEVVSIEDSHSLLDYIEDVIDLIQADKDMQPYISIDVSIPAFPIISLLVKDSDYKGLIFRVLRTWCKFEHEM